MADAVSTNVLVDDTYHYIACFTNLSDGTGESAVIKVNKSDLTASDGAEPAALEIQQVQYSVVGMNVTVLWDHTTDDTALELAGSGFLDFRFDKNDMMNSVHQRRALIGLTDPRSTGGTGDILFTTTGHDSGDSYTIVMVFFKNPD